MSDVSAWKDLLDAIGKAFKSRKTRRAELYQDLVASRFAILETTNQGFLVGLQKMNAGLRNLEMLSSTGANHQRPAVEALLAELGRLDAWRAEGRGARRQLYEEAQLIAESKSVSIRDIVVVMSPDEQAAHRDFMASIMAYFRTNRAYEHEFAVVLEKTNRIAREWLENEINARDVALAQAAVVQAETELLGRWSAVCSAFARLQLSLKSGVEITQ